MWTEYHPFLSINRVKPPIYEQNQFQWMFLLHHKNDDSEFAVEAVEFRWRESYTQFRMNVLNDLAFLIVYATASVRSASEASVTPPPIFWIASHVC